MSRTQPDPNAATDYVALPVSPGQGGALLLHAWWGLTPFVTGFADRLAAEGLIVLAPDLYGGRTASTIDEAKKLRSSVKQEVVAGQVLDAAERLRALSALRQAPDRRLACIGFSLGAYWGLRLSEQAQPSLAAVVAYYGTRTGSYTAARAAFQFHLAESDVYVPASGVVKLLMALKAAGREAEFHAYPGTGHWFMESDRPAAYHPQAADLAWSRTLAFLRAHQVVT